MDDIDNPKPVWIPPSYKEMDIDIHKKNVNFASHNPFVFNDIARSRGKLPGYYKIAVLGDSFIWGGGVNYSGIWSHKLEEKINKKYNNIETLSWGISGWNTLDELIFWRRFGKKFNIDYLIVGFVDNDPDLNNVERRNFKWQQSRAFYPVAKIFPLTFDFLVSYFNAFLENFFKEYGYNNWLKQTYSKENLEKYENVLQKFAQSCKDNDTPLLFVLTASNYHSSTKERHEKITSLLEKVGIDYLDLYPDVYEKFHDVNIRSLWANPANGHPGKLLTELYSQKVLSYLENEVKLEVISKENLNKKNTYSEFLSGIDNSPFPTYFKITNINGKEQGKETNHITVRAGSKYLYFAGEMIDRTAHGPIGSLYALLDGRLFPAALGPVYSVSKHVGSKTQFIKVPDSEKFFSIYVPMSGLNQELYNISFIAITADNKKYKVLGKTIRVTMDIHDK
ncbi:MAG: SGNH/GDSL hydrolase family protein [Proteobacteria bacterium]|nr:SGNH/GDSL hydrolase family protein [Pseudomonadota bacterium]